jgi:hypothetical protein
MAESRPDAIVAWHHPEGTFWLHAAGQTVGIGREAIRARFANTLALLPDIAFDSLRVHWGESFLVHEMSASGAGADFGRDRPLRSSDRSMPKPFTIVATGPVQVTSPDTD